ncbi:MAG: hypothetical protein JWN76_746 [Chitinophagaceae bacterium]|nr:hypothetical protein [Chitinophagaceae bacterium]
MNPDIKQVHVTKEKKLLLIFENGEIKFFDLNPYLKYRVYKPLADEQFLKKAYVFNGTVCWNDEIDFAPDTLYLESEYTKEAEILKLICDAMDQKRLIKFFYKNIGKHKEEFRILEPYMLILYIEDRRIEVTGWLHPTPEQLEEILNNPKYKDKDDRYRHYTISNIDFDTVEKLEEVFNEIKAAKKIIEQTTKSEIIHRVYFESF